MPSERKYMEFKLGYSGLSSEEVFVGEFCNYSFLLITQISLGVYIAGASHTCNHVGRNFLLLVLLTHEDIS